MPYNVGDAANVSILLRDGETKQKVATTVTCAVQKPNGSQEMLTVTNPSLGRYVARVTFDDSGKWVVQFTGIAPYPFIEEWITIVARNQFVAD